VGTKPHRRQIVCSEQLEVFHVGQTSECRLEQLYAIESALEAMIAAKDDFAQWVEADITFHTALYIASNNVFMAPLANLFRQYFNMSFRVSSSNQHHQHCLKEHRDVFDAIRQRDPVAADRTVRVLLAHASEDVSTVLSTRS
jgi:GntR family galactonate operon transcriptional repressor